LLARYRNGSDERLTIKQATVGADFYDVGDEGVPDDALERWFDRSVENPVGELMEGLRKGLLPTSESARVTLAAFVAAQMVRTMAFRQLMEGMSSHIGPALFACMALQRAIENNPSLKSDEEQLKNLYQYLVDCAPDAVRTVGRKSMMRNMVREASRLKPLLRCMNWVLTSSAEPMLLTT
jgi:hypothetical protein